jgi:uncharacterized membrane protein YphA (DoxX/SURF4 family)
METIQPKLATDLQIGLGFIFVLAGVLKFSRDNSQQSRLLEAIGIFGNETARLLVKILPSIEVLLGLWLISGLFALPALLVAVAILCTFLGIVTFAFWKGYKFGCACFGSDNTRYRLGITNILVDSLLMLAAVYACHVTYTTESNFFIIQIQPIDWFVCAGMLIWLFGLQRLTGEVESVMRELQEETTTLGNQLRA